MILDTCAVLWLSFNREKLTKDILQLIDLSDNLIISTMSFWEIGIKINKKKLEIPMKLKKLASLFVHSANVRIIVPDLDIILKTLELKWNHKDPVDRIIVAMATLYDDQIITSDKIIRNFYKKTII